MKLSAVILALPFVGASRSSTEEDRIVWMSSGNGIAFGVRTNLRATTTPRPPPPGSPPSPAYHAGVNPVLLGA